MPEMQGQEIGTDPLGLPGKDLEKELTTPLIGGGVAVFLPASPPIPIHFDAFVKRLHDHRPTSAIDTMGGYTYTTRIMEVCNAKEIDPNR
jgi:hypothetical protein